MAYNDYGYEQLAVYGLGDVVDTSQVVTITLIQEGIGTFISHTFPASAAVGQTVTGIVSVRNDGYSDTIFATLTSSPTVTWSPGSRQFATVNAGSSFSFPQFSFTMPASSVTITISVGHVV